MSRDEERKNKQKEEEKLQRKKEKEERIEEKNTSEKELKKIVSERVKKVMEYSEVSQKEFAIDMGCDLSNLQKILTGTRALAPVYAKNIAELYDVSMDYLYGLSEYMNDNEIIIDKILKQNYEMKIIKKSYMNRKLEVIDSEMLEFTLNENLIQYLYEANKINENLRTNKITEEFYNEKMELLRDTFRKRLIKKDNGIKSKHILLPKIMLCDDLVNPQVAFKKLNEFIKSEDFKK